MNVHILSIFDKNHLGRAAALRESLATHSPASHVRFLCLDEVCYETAKKLNLPDTTVMKPEDLNDSALLESRKTRTNPEFASTCKPAFLKYVMDSGIVKPEDLLVFIDPDFSFYESAEPLWKKIYQNGSIMITPHRFPKRREHEQFKKGIYNAGIVAFKNDPEAKACLAEWRLQCIEWCYLRYENGQIGDQGYLSEWPKKYKGVYELSDKGVNLSTWNIENYSVKETSPGHFSVDGEPLVCYHFHGQKIYFDNKERIRTAPSTVYHSGIYKAYEPLLTRAYEKLKKIDPSWTFGTIPRPSPLRLLKQKVWKAFF